MILRKTKLHKIVNRLSSLNKSESKSGYGAKSKYVMVPNQWQTRCESLQVIGVKRSAYMNCVSNIDILETFRENLSEESVSCLKFIFTVRNPYDMINTSMRYKAKKGKIKTATQVDIGKILHKRIKNFAEVCKKIEVIFALIKAEDIFINRHEDMVASPVDQLSKLCDFLKVPAFPDYLNDCASVVDKKANKSRYELDWSEQQKEEVAELIDKYHFLSGYSWDS